jgi:hypothetical protein
MGVDHAVRNVPDMRRNVGAALLHLDTGSLERQDKVKAEGRSGSLGGGEAGAGGQWARTQGQDAAQPACGQLLV